MLKAVSLRTHAGSFLKGEKEIKLFLLPDKERANDARALVRRRADARAGDCGIDGVVRMSRKVLCVQLYANDAAADVCHERLEIC